MRKGHRIPALVLSIVFLFSLLLFPGGQGNFVWAQEATQEDRDRTSVFGKIPDPENENVSLLVRGKYQAVDREALLQRMNTIRKEAVKLGFADRYVPLVWSNGMEEIARLRAAETTIIEGHQRPMGATSPYMTASNGLRNTAESLAFNERGLARAIEQFYEEKELYQKTPPEKRHDPSMDTKIGHYRVLIDPHYRKVGGASFRSDAADLFQIAFAFTTKTTETSLSLSPLPKGEVQVPIEVSGERVRDFVVNGPATVEVGQPVQFSARATVERFDLFTEDKVTTEAPMIRGLAWTLTPATVGTVNNGLVKLQTQQPATLTATLGNRMRRLELNGAIEDKVQTKVRRYAGARREDVAAVIAEEFFRDARTVIIVNDRAFGDAISATNLAQGVAPILYTKKEHLPSATTEALRKMKPTRVILMGGPQSVSDHISAAIQKALPKAQVTRVTGKDRFDVNKATLPPATNGLIVVNGLIFSDALIAAPLAAQSQNVVALVKPKALPPSIGDAVSTLHESLEKVTVVGGPRSVSNQVLQALEARAERKVPRLTATNRYTLSATVAREFGPTTDAILVSGEVFSDALVAAPLAQKMKTPILLTKQGSLSDEVRAVLAEREKVLILGGTNSVSSEIESMVSGR